MCVSQRTGNLFSASFKNSHLLQGNKYGQGKTWNERGQETGRIDPQGKKGGQTGQETGEITPSAIDSSLIHESRGEFRLATVTSIAVLGRFSGQKVHHIEGPLYAAFCCFSAFFELTVKFRKLASDCPEAILCVCVPASTPVVQRWSRF